MTDDFWSTFWFAAMVVGGIGAVYIGAWPVAAVILAGAVLLMLSDRSYKEAAKEAPPPSGPTCSLMLVVALIGLAIFVGLALSVTAVRMP